MLPFVWKRFLRVSCICGSDYVRLMLYADVCYVVITLKTRLVIW